MSTTAQEATAPGIWSRIWDALIRLAESSPRIRALNALNATSDEELAARGMTRHEAIKRIVGTHW